MYKFILASASPDRQKILKKFLPITFETVPSKFDESIFSYLPPRKQAQKLAEEKAKTVFLQLKKPLQTIILGVDTLVSFKDEVIGKAKDKKHAENIIRKLSANWHDLITGYSLIIKNGKRRHKNIKKTIVTKVYMQELPEVKLQKYLDSNNWKNKAGAYGIQQKAKKFIPKIKGCFLNVVGLPLCHLIQELEAFDIKVDLKKTKLSCEKMNKIKCCVKII